MKLKVAFFVVGLNTGGIENYLLRFLKEYNNLIDPTVYCKAGWIGELESEFIAENIKVKKFKIGYFNPVDFLKLKKELKTQEFNAIIDFTGNFSAFVMLMGKFSNINSRVTWYRNANDKFKKDFIRVFLNKILNKITLSNASVILSNSKAAFDYFYKDYNWINDKRFEVIYNGIDAVNFLNNSNNLRKELNIPDSAFVVGNIGRFNEQKNHKTAIEVAIKLCENYSNIYFIFCGKGVGDIYEDYINNKGLNKRILFLGIRRDVINVLNTLDCFYFPSILEGQPNALIEAMVANIPFVASNIDPVKETVPKELHSYLLPPLEINLAVESILKIKDDAEFKNKFLVQDWAIKKFDSKTQFRKFYNKI